MDGVDVVGKKGEGVDGKRVTAPVAGYSVWGSAVTPGICVGLGKCGENVGALGNTGCKDDGDVGLCAFADFFEEDLIGAIVGNSVAALYDFLELPAFENFCDFCPFGSVGVIGAVFWPDFSKGLVVLFVGICWESLPEFPPLFTCLIETIGIVFEGLKFLIFGNSEKSGFRGPGPSFAPLIKE